MGRCLSVAIIDGINGIGVAIKISNIKEGED